MLKHTNVTIARIRQFIVRELRDRVIAGQVATRTSFCPSAAPCEEQVRAEGAWEPIEPGYCWGPAYAHAWYRVQAEAPEAWAGRAVYLTYGEPTIEFERDWMVEGTVWRGNQPIGGLDRGHHYFRISDGSTEGEGIDLCIQAFAHNAQVAIHGEEKPREPKPERFQGFTLVCADHDLYALYLDCRFCLDLLTAIEPTDPSHATLVRALNDVCNAFDPERPRSVARCRRILREAQDGLDGEIKHTVTPVGHAHLDSAWLWPIDVTKLKMVHTTAVQLDLIDRYPEYVFVHSQACQYEWLEKEYPALFERVKKAIRRGQWEVVGSMWVEADCNLTGPEALVRQFLYGRRYFESKLGVTTEDMWLPDVFGYSAALPQILTKFGIKYFLTQKMSWNQFNKIPHHTFWWQGVDGSRVWTHFPPADTYNATCEPSEIVGSVKAFKDHARCDHSLLVFGFGDGGGGPKDMHIESLRRARVAPNMPAVAGKKRALQFFRDAYAESKDLMTWAGELYFEAHRGTYTSQAATKKGNRESEFLMRDVEWLATFNDNLSAYPAAEIERLWKLVLLNQFHDIIPGSSVREVYQDAAKAYAEVKECGERLVRRSLAGIGGKLDTAGMARPVALFHNSVTPSQGAIEWSEPETPNSLVVGSTALPVQLVEEFGERKLVFRTPEEALGAVAVGDLSDAPPTERPRLKAAGRRLENGELSVKFDANGNITSIQTLEEHPTEFIEPGRLGNLFQLFDDQPLSWAAWDVDVFALETETNLLKSESFEVVERGPVRAAVEVVKRFGKSTIRQRISLGPTPGIRFDTEIDWHEDNKMLKVAFPLNVNASTAKYEIQFGHVERPTHRNTSWDLARFEVCAQKWADMSEGGHGAALLNDGKYGHDALDNVLRMTLLRSPKAPDPTCDMGVHRFTYVLLPHYDQVQHSDVVAAAYGLNAPVRYALLEPREGFRAQLPPFVSCDNRSIVIESVKKAEDSNRIVVRLYECHNSRGSTDLVCALPVRAAWLADLNETPVAELEVRDGVVPFDYKPFEIVTLMLEV